MGIGMRLLDHKGFTGLSRLLHEISGVSVMRKSAWETHGNKQNTRHIETPDVRRVEVEAVGSQPS
jgi:hypothetical protein